MQLSEPTIFDVPAARPTTAGGSSRYAYLDVLRGALLLVMAINHVPSDLHGLTDHFFGYVSAAEGFVFLAGLMAGLVYTRKLMREGADGVRRASLRRAGTIYAYHLAAYLFIFVWVAGCRFFMGVTPSVVPEQILAHPAIALLVGPALVYQPSLFDILPMYCGFMLLIPTLLGVLERGDRRRLFALSFATWAVANVFLPQAPIIAGLMNSGAFNIAAWQLVFVTGVIFGHAWARGESLLPNPRLVTIVLVSITAAWLFLVRHAYTSSGMPAPVLDWLTNKNNLAPLRLFNAALVFWLVRSFLQRYPKALSWRPLEFLGRHSICVFTFHVVIAYVIYTFPAEFAEDANGRLWGTMLMIGGLFAAAGAHHLLHSKSSRPERSLLPARSPGYEGVGRSAVNLD